jgi:hypothetical protein
MEPEPELGDAPPEFEGVLGFAAPTVEGVPVALGVALLAGLACTRRPETQRRLATAYRLAFAGEQSWPARTALVAELDVVGVPVRDAPVVVVAVVVVPVVVPVVAWVPVVAAPGAGSVTPPPGAPDELEEEPQPATTSAADASAGASNAIRPGIC